eukprot:gene6967-16710_t
MCYHICKQLATRKHKRDMENLKGQECIADEELLKTLEQVTNTTWVDLRTRLPPPIPHLLPTLLKIEAREYYARGKQEQTK